MRRCTKIDKYEVWSSWLTFHKNTIRDWHIVYFRLGFSDRHTSPILVYTVWVSDRPWFFLFWYKINPHGMSIVAGYFMTIVSSQTWNRNTFNLKLHEFKIFRDGHILCSLLFQRSTKHIWPLWWYDDDDDWFASGLMIAILERY